MGLSVGIVGLPNVGKSTVFNALLKRQSSFAEPASRQGGAVEDRQASGCLLLRLTFKEMGSIF